MRTDSPVYWLLYVIVTIAVAWVALSLILLWFRPIFYNEDGSVNWWTTLWVAALMLLFAWIIMLLVGWLIDLFTNGINKCDPCKKPDPCPKPCPKPDPCDPCATGVRKTSVFGY